jgi:hypothetical protein
VAEEGARVLKPLHQRQHRLSAPPVPQREHRAVSAPINAMYTQRSWNMIAELLGLMKVDIMSRSRTMERMRVMMIMLIIW